MQRLPFDVAITLERYTSNPYWLEVDDKVEIIKVSGMSRAQSPAKREAALAAHLKKIGMTTEQWDALCERAARPWERIDNEDQQSEIVMPGERFLSALVHACDVSPSTVMPKSEVSRLRHIIRAGDFRTGKHKADGVFDRFVKSELSNQRRRNRSEILIDTTFTGVIHIDPSVKPERVKNLIDWAASNTGFGASRKMGLGRGELTRFAPMAEDIE